MAQETKGPGGKMLIRLCKEDAPWRRARRVINQSVKEKTSNPEDDIGQIFIQQKHAQLGTAMGFDVDDVPCDDDEGVAVRPFQLSMRDRRLALVECV